MKPPHRPNRRIAILLAYIALLLASRIVQNTRHRTPAAPPDTPGLLLRVPETTAAGPTDTQIELHVLPWGEPDPTRPPVILLHGSPGAASNFDLLAPRLADDGRAVYAPDLPGFGLSTHRVADYSIRAHARAVLEMMDALGIGRAHVVGWSMGGGVALSMADLDPDRLASLTLLSAVGAQETEGSGNFFFEHLKYAVGVALIDAIDIGLPHFGLLDLSPARAFLRNFWDSDQRPLRGVMMRTTIPVLIVHGSRDPLISVHAARRHHELIPTSRLVITPYSHFMPFVQPDETAAVLNSFFARHDTPGVSPETGTTDRSPPRPGGSLARALDAVRGIPWWVAILLFALLARLRPETATALAGLGAASMSLDFGVAVAGLLAGRALHPPEPWRRRDLRWFVTLPVWSVVSLSTAQLLAGPVLPGHAPGWWFVWVVAVSVLLNAIKCLPTHTGRRRLVAALKRFTHHEWWPSWALYLALLPAFLRLAFKHRSLVCWTCVNPGIKPGGGIVGESKQEILNNLHDAHVLTQRAFEPGEPDRTARALACIESDMGGYPIIVKPDAGERGAGVVRARSPRDAALAVAATPGRVLVQRYHPGPVEIGVFWIRDVRTVGDESGDGPQGSIYAVTRKVFPVVVGNGRHTLRRLILDHPRYNLQAGVYCRHLRDRLDDIPEAGERITITTAGNHARGCRFEDGSDLITPAFEEAIDSIARSWRGPEGEPFDYGRFDIRSVSEDDLAAGRELAVIELNGITSEATNIYDPSWPARRALAVLAGQWSRAFELGAARMSLGVRPMTLSGLLRLLLLPGRG